MTDEEQLREDRKLVKRIDDFAEGLGDRETDFVESCVKRLAEGRPLSEPMRMWALDIDEKKVP